MSETKNNGEVFKIPESEIQPTAEQNDPEASDDLPASSLPIIQNIMNDHPYTKKYGQKFADNVISRAVGNPKERTD